MSQLVHLGKREVCWHGIIFDFISDDDIGLGIIFSKGKVEQKRKKYLLEEKEYDLERYFLFGDYFWKIFVGNQILYLFEVMGTKNDYENVFHIAEAYLLTDLRSVINDNLIKRRHVKFL